jgi:hypothetical protein
MIRVYILAAMLGAAPVYGESSAPIAEPAPHPSPPVDFKHLPWSDGEALTYLISWTAFDAAEGTFTTMNKGDHWEFNLKLASRGIVDSFYPFMGTFWSLLAPMPWRSTEYGEYRFEPHRTIKERTQIDYPHHQGTREIWNEGKTKAFPVAEDAIDDIGTMLYHLRAGPWKPGDKRTLYVYESNSEKQAEAECQSREMLALGTWPAQPLLRILVLPTKGTHRRGHLLLWMTDDARRLPLHAEIEFRYGTFDIDLVKTGKATPTGH